MPRVPVKPLIKLSKKQLAAVFERELDRSGGKLTQEGISNIRKFEPLVTRETGALTTKSAEKGMSTVERLPIEDARKKFYKNPEMYTPHKGGPPALEIRPSVPGEEAEVGRHLSYERVRNLPVDTAKARREHLMSTPVSEIVSNDAHAERIWGMIGGGRSVGGKLWERFRQSSRLSSKINNSKDYFKSSFIRWKEQPKSFRKNFPREAAILDEVWSKYSAPNVEGAVE